MSKLIGGYSTAAAFRLIEKAYPEITQKWHYSNENQKLLLEEVESLKPYVDKFFLHEIYNLVTTESEEINKVLEKNGFAQRITKLPPDPEVLYFLSLLTIKQSWSEGLVIADSMLIDNVGYRGFRLQEALCHDNNFVNAKLENGDDVFIFMTDENNEEGFNKEIELFKENRDSIDPFSSGSGISGSAINVRPTYYNKNVRAHIPCVDMIMEKQLDVNNIYYGSLLHGTKFYRLIEGIFGHKFTMNAGGIEVKEYTALSGSAGSSGSCGPSTVRINKPFYIAIQREGTPEPYFKTYVTKANLIKQIATHEI